MRAHSCLHARHPSFSPSPPHLRYDILKQKTKSNEIAKGNFRAIIVDESHNVKSRTAQRCKALVDLMNERFCPVRLLLSGTPMPSRHCEIWTQAFIVMPSLFPDYNEFARRYCNRKETMFNGKKTFDDKDSVQGEELNRLLLTHTMVRRLKREILKGKDVLPDKERLTQLVKVTPQGRDAIVELYKATDKLMDELGKVRGNAKEEDRISCELRTNVNASQPAPAFPALSALLFLTPPLLPARAEAVPGRRRRQGARRARLCALDAEAARGRQFQDHQARRRWRRQAATTTRC
jgi:hypothetical protein